MQRDDVNFTNIGNEAQVPRTTFQEYFDILRNTLLVHEVLPWQKSEKRKPIRTAKYYFFDVEVIVAPNDAAFVYTGEDQVSFTGAAPLTFAGLQEAARVKCGCDPGECGNGTLCIGTCVDLHSDPGNCGSCGHACAGGQACDAGTCIDTCEGADLQTDEANCGSCGDECGYGEECVSGICKRVCPSPYDGGAAYYVSYPCDSVRCNCQLEVCISGACRAWSGPYETEAIHGRFIPDPLRHKPTDGYCPTSHPFASRTLNLQSVFGFRCCDYYQTDCVCRTLGVGSVMETDGYCYPAEE